MEISGSVDSNVKTLLICGAGNGMHTLVPTVAKHFDGRIKIYTPFAGEAEKLNTRFDQTGGIVVTGFPEQTRSKPFLTTSDAQEAAADVDMVLMVLPAFAHGDILNNLAPYLTEGIRIGAMPARSGLEYQACRILTAQGLKNFTVFGLQTLPWACRIKAFGDEVEILGTKHSVGVAAIPKNATTPLAGLLSRMLNVTIDPMDNMLALSLANIGQIVHPGIMYGLFKHHKNSTFTEDEIPLFYQSVNDEIAAVLQCISDEIQLTRILLQRQMGAGIDLSQVPTLYEWLLKSYTGQIGDVSTLARSFQTNKAYQELKAPVRKIDKDRYGPDFQSRYLLEDVPTGLVVSAGLARLADVPVPTIDDVILTTSAWMGKQYLRNGDFIGSDILQTRLPQNFEIKDLDRLKKVVVAGSLI